MSHYAPFASHFVGSVHSLRPFVAGPVSESRYYHRPHYPSRSRGAEPPGWHFAGAAPLITEITARLPSPAARRRAWCACAQHAHAPSHPTPHSSDEDAGTGPAQLLRAQHGPTGTGRAGRTRVPDAPLMCSEGVPCGRTWGRDAGPTAGAGRRRASRSPYAPQPSGPALTVAPPPRGRCRLPEHRDLPVGTGLVRIQVLCPDACWTGTGRLSLWPAPNGSGGTWAECGAQRPGPPGLGRRQEPAKEAGVERRD